MIFLTSALIIIYKTNSPSKYNYSLDANPIFLTW